MSDNMRDEVNRQKIAVKAYSNDLRRKLIEIYETEKISQRQLAARFNVSLNFITTLLRRYRNTGGVDPAPRPGRKSLLSPADLKQLESLVTEQPNNTLAEFCRQLEARTGISISRTTMVRCLEKLGYRKHKQCLSTSKTHKKGGHYRGIPENCHHHTFPDYPSGI
jgi:putative transposase